MEPRTIPDTLWSDEQVIMPPVLAVALRSKLEMLGRFNEACGVNPSDRELFGGADEEDAVKHFVHRFKTSSARTQYITMSPCGGFEQTSTDLVAFLLDGDVSALDIPCGSGGGLLGYICTIAELRNRGKLPRTPVNLKLFAGDISAEGRSLHADMLHRALPHLEEAGIRVDVKYHHWDVMDPFSTAKLVDTWLAECPNADDHLVFVSAFSGFADKHTDITLRAVDLIVSRFHSKPFILTWIEPTMKPSKRVLERLAKWLTDWFAGALSLRSSKIERNFFYKHPFTAERIPGRVQVRSYKRDTSS